MTSALVLIGSFDSTDGEASARNLALGNTLARHADIWCVGDDLDLLPASAEGGGPTYLHWRHYLADSALAALPRLHLADDDAAGGLLFHALRVRPGALLLFTDTLFDAFVDDFKQRGEWPHGFANWLVATYGPEGDVLAEALVNRRRFTDSLAAAMPALAPAASLADTVYAASPSIANLLAADGASATVLKAPPLAPLQTLVRPLTGEIVIACPEAAPAVRAAADAIRSLGRAVRLTTPADAGWPTGATVAVHLEADPAPAWSPFVRTMAETGVPLVHASPRLPPDAGVRIDHAGAHHQLVAAIGALASDAALADARARILHTYIQGLTSADDLTSLLLPALKAPVATQPDAPVAPHIALSFAPPDAVPQGRTMLIGAVPGPAVIARIWPDIDAAASPRFAAPAIAKQFSEATGLPAAGLLARLGFEAPVIGSDEDVIRQKKELRRLDTVASAAAPWHAGAMLQLQPSVSTGDGPWRSCADGGTLWMLDHRGLSLRCLLLAGSTSPVYLENRGEDILRIASTDRTFDLAPGATERVPANTDGLVDFRLRLMLQADDPAAGPERMTGWLNSTGLWMTR